MSLKFDTMDVDNIIFNGNIVETLIYNGTVVYTKSSTEELPTCVMLVSNSVTWEATETTDYIEDGSYASDFFIAGGYLPNNEGVIVPVLYKTDSSYQDEPDMQEIFYYVGQADYSGLTCDRWIKVEDGTDSDYYGWDSSSKRYAYTNIVVSNNRFISGILQ